MACLDKRPNTSLVQTLLSSSLGPGANPRSLGTSTDLRHSSTRAGQTMTSIGCEERMSLSDGWKISFSIWNVPLSGRVGNGVVIGSVESSFSPSGHSTETMSFSLGAEALPKWSDGQPASLWFNQCFRKSLLRLTDSHRARFPWTGL